MGFSGSEDYKPVSDRIVKLFEAIDTTLGEWETYPGFQCWDTIKLLPEITTLTKDEDAHEYVRRVLLSQGNKPLHREDILSITEGDRIGDDNHDGNTPHASIGATTTSPSLNNDSSSIKSCEDEEIDDAAEDGENTTDVNRGMKDLDCNPEKDNDSQDCVLVTDDVTQDVSEDSTKADEGCL